MYHNNPYKMTCQKISSSREWWAVFEVWLILKAENDNNECFPPSAA